MKKRAGFTLIEVMISLSVFVVGIIFLFPFFSGGLRMVGDIDRQTTIANLARAKMSQIETQSFITAPTNSARTAFPAPHSEYEYSIEWQSVSSDIAENTNTILYEVKLTLYWGTGAGEKTEIFKTFITRLRPY
jgi:prepilin-type N-terminal cleavage/methylation domain-containing protein